jgi:hypothetical protein
VEVSGHGLNQALTGIHLEGQKKNAKNLRIADVPDEIRTDHLPNTSLSLISKSAYSENEIVGS